MKTALPILLSVALLLPRAFADVVEEGAATLNGDDYAFSLKAPPGWVLDNESGVDQGLPAVFYPKGGNWKDSAIVAYARTRRKTPEIATADDVAKAVADDFHAHGAPKYEARRVKTIRTNAGQDAVIYYFTGDQWGNSEAAAYYTEKKTVNFVVLSARDPKTFADSSNSFETLVKSYVFLGDHPIDDLKPGSATKQEGPSEPFAVVRARAHRMGESAEGKVYEKLFSDAFAKPMKEALQECTKDISTPYAVDLVFVIAADGTARRVLSAPGQPVSARVAKKLTGEQLPAPPKPDWLVSVNLSVEE